MLSFVDHINQYLLKKELYHIPCKSLYYASTNVEGTGLDISNGIFTTGRGHPGTYSVIWTLHNNFTGHKDLKPVVLYLYKNDVEIRESQYASQYVSQQTDSLIEDQGAVHLFLHLDRGDTLALHCSEFGDSIRYVMFCVSLSQFDVI